MPSSPRWMTNSSGPPAFTFSVLNVAEACACWSDSESWRHRFRFHRLREGPFQGASAAVMLVTASAQESLTKGGYVGAATLVGAIT